MYKKLLVLLCSLASLCTTAVVLARASQTSYYTTSGTTYRITPMQPQHFHAVWDLIISILFEQQVIPCTSPQEIEQLARAHNEFYDLENLDSFYFNNRGTCLVVLDNTTVVGVGALCSLDAETCELRRMYFTKEHRGKGLGKYVATTLLEYARASGYTKARLTVFRPSIQQPAVHLYNKLGFYEIAPYKESPGELFMEKSLSNKPVNIITLAPEQWQLYKELRLAGIQDTPQVVLDETKDADECYQTRLRDAVLGKNVWQFFAECDGKIVGMAGATREGRSFEQHVVFIGGVYVLPEFRGQGIGEKLTRTVLECLEKDPSVQLVLLGTTSSQEAAISLYKKLGFSICATIHNRRIVNGKEYDVYMMEKLINRVLRNNLALPW